MRRILAVLLALAAVPSNCFCAEGLRFWNLTSVTITKLYLTPAGTTEWGPDQCKNDPDGAVDPDERLTLKGIEPGRYDVKVTDKSGRTCVVSGVELKGGQAYAFSIDEHDLRTCDR